jgi:hypothetical protein
VSLTNGQIIGTNYDAREYMKSACPRGSVGYVMSRSDLMEFAVCPSRWIKGAKVEDETDSTEWGSLIDCLLTDGKRFEDRFAIKPEKYPVLNKGGMPTDEMKSWNGNSTWCKEWVASQGGKICISRADYHDAVNAAHRAAEALADELTDLQVYATADYHDSDTGISVPLKVLIDVVPKKILTKSLIDIKTAKCGDPAKWGRVCFDRGYHVQGALQLDVYNAATGENRDEFRHIVQENFPPYEISKPWLDYTFIDLGRQKYRHALQLYAQCLKTGHWHSYDDLQRENYGGWSSISAESWMIEPAPSVREPDWISG